jgi:hypothetical protein
MCYRREMWRNREKTGDEDDQENGGAAKMYLRFIL